MPAGKPATNIGGQRRFADPQQAEAGKEFI
jgi:hypothetical protein